MIRPVFCAVFTVCVLAATQSQPVLAGTWADSFFTEDRHDFGMVPRGVKVKHDFLLTNRLAEPVTILNLRPSCGCTSGVASVATVQPGQTATIEATMDTRNFVGAKSTILYVSMITAGGVEAETGLGVSSFILSDIVLNPGAIEFGTVSKGQAPTQVLTIDKINAPNYRFERMASKSRAIRAQLLETARENGSVSYSLSVSLRPDAPAGIIRDEIRLFSNDAETPSIPVSVTAYIRGDLSAAPSVLALGQVNSAGGVEGRFIVRGSKPFAIQSIEGAGNGFTIAPTGAARQSTHVVTVAYKPDASGSRGDIRHVFRVHTDLPGEAPVDVTATLHVEP
jgi:hypothetical protein